MSRPKQLGHGERFRTIRRCFPKPRSTASAAAISKAVGKTTQYNFNRRLSLWVENGWLRVAGPDRYALAYKGLLELHPESLVLRDTDGGFARILALIWLRDCDDAEIARELGTTVEQLIPTLNRMTDEGWLKRLHLKSSQTGTYTLGPEAVRDKARRAG